MENPFDLLRTAREEEDVFSGQPFDIGAPQLYGGLVLGQGLYAAAQTVPTDRLAHSLHAYFILPGSTESPVRYEIDRIRDGKSFTTRRVVAFQNGKAIFNMSISFQLPEKGIEHQIEKSIDQGPEGLKNLKQINMEAAANAPEPIQKYLESWSRIKWPVEMRPVHSHDPISPPKQDPFSQVWFRIKVDVPKDDIVFKQAVLACVSDYTLLSTTLLPHGLSWFKGIKQAASLDHAMWFHDDYDVDEWLLYDKDSPVARSARGLNRGMIYDPSGRLIASTIQEGLIRTI